jgi:isopropylmalate/homocitrate/citramalate synthase
VKKFELVDVKEPNLLKHIFPHTEVPRISFDGKIYEEIDGNLVTFNPADIQARDICITDTTFRDGQQSRPPYTVEQIVDIYGLLAKLSGPNGIIRQSEFFVYSKNDREAIEKCLASGHRYPQVTGWIRADEGDLSFVQKLGLKETGILSSCSDYHIFYKQKMNRREAMEHYLKIVKMALDAGIRPRCHLEDVTRADIDGFVGPLVQQLMTISEGVPKEMKVKIRLCDTLGFGISYPGSELPRSVPKLIHKTIHDFGVPSDLLEWHGHNDFHKVHINAGTAWLYGANFLNATLLGIGERTGNPPLEGAVFEYIGLKGDADGMDTQVITEIADYYRHNVGFHIPARYPFVGSDFNKTRAGIHAWGLRRDTRVYNIFDTDKLLNRPTQIGITDKSGADGVVLWVNNFLGLSGKEALGKIPLVKIMSWARDQYEVHGRTTAISDEEMEALVKEHLPKYHAARLGQRKS